MSLDEVISDILKLEHFRRFACSICGGEIKHHVLQIYAECPSCREKHKTRAFGGVGTEIQDVIDAVLEWAGEGETLAIVLKRQKEIQSEITTNKKLS